MVISVEAIEDNLFALVARADRSKCDAQISRISDGFSLDIRTYGPRYCPIHLEITPHVFDISSGEMFSESDIFHDKFSFYDIVLSVISGHVRIKARKTMLVFRRPVLEVSLPDSNKFFLSYASFLPSTRVKEVQYISYMR